MAVAEAEGKAPSEWARDLLLRGVAASDRGEMEMHIFTELVGIQMLLMNTLEPLLRGEKLAQEQLAISIPPSPDNQGCAGAGTPRQAQSE